MSSDMIQTQSPVAGTMSVATTRQSSEVQSAMIIAKNFPRDEIASITRLIKSCKRPGLAECAMYSYPKGKQVVTGASIRLAEAMAQAWGNIDYGLIELEQKNGESSVMAYAWDLETNTRRQMVFQVPHVRSTREGNRLLTDPRDIYEMVANQGARRVRACILGVIPGDVQDIAVDQCEKTLADGSGKSLDDRIRDMVLAFDGLGVSKDMLEARLQIPVAKCDVHMVVAMQKIYLSIRDGIGKREDWFDLKSGAATTTADTDSKTSRTDNAASVMKEKSKPKQTSKKADDPPPEQKVSDKPWDVQIVEAETTEAVGAIFEAIKAAGLTDEEIRFYENLSAKRVETLLK